MTYSTPKNYSVVCPSCLAKITFNEYELKTMNKNNPDITFDDGSKYIICPNPTCRNTIHIEDIMKDVLSSKIRANY